MPIARSLADLLWQNASKCNTADVVPDLFHRKNCTAMVLSDLKVSPCILLRDCTLLQNLASQATGPLYSSAHPPSASAPISRRSQAPSSNQRHSNANLFQSFTMNYQNGHLKLTPCDVKLLCFLPTLFLIISTMSGAMAAPDARKPPIILDRTGGFSVGGKVITDPKTNQTLSCDHGYMEYFIPRRPRKTSIVMWHSSHTQGWQNRWDGGEGFKDMFLRRNYPVYLWDAPRLGRAGWGCVPYNYILDYRDKSNFVAWNFGPSFMNWWPGVQFPTEDAEAWNQATRSRYIEFDNWDNIEVQSDAAAIAADSGKLGKSIVFLGNSAAGLRAMMATIKSNTTNIQGIVSYESIGNIFPDDVDLPPEWSNTGFGDAFGPFKVPVDDFKKLARIPIQFVWGDNRETFVYLNQSQFVADQLTKYGGKSELLRLAKDEGLTGSTHIAFADMDNDKVAVVLDKYLRNNRLDHY
jgi:hypothetical protein